MAFSQNEKSRILFYLGYSVFEDDGPAMRAINSLDSVEAKARPIVQPIMDEIERIRREISQVTEVALAIEDGSVKLRGAYTLQVLRSMGVQQVGDLSGFLAVPAKRNIFAASLPDGASLASGDPSEARLDCGAPSRCT